MTALHERLQDVLAAMREASPQCASFADRLEAATALQGSGGEVVPDPVLCRFYQVETVEQLLAAQEEHILKLQDTVRRNVKPWEDTFPPTLLPKYLRESGLASPAQPSDGWRSIDSAPLDTRVLFWNTETEEITSGYKPAEAPEPDCVIVGMTASYADFWRPLPPPPLTTPPTQQEARAVGGAWTKEAPTESGWYWHDDRDAMRLHYVFTRPGHAYLCTEGEPYGPGQKRNFQAVQKMGGVWSGPVNPPTRAALHPGATK